MRPLRPGSIAAVRSSAFGYGMALAALLFAAPVSAQNTSANTSAPRQTCDPGFSFGNPACRSNVAPASRAYERWQSGTPATATAGSGSSNYGPTYYHGYNALYGFGR